MKRTRFWLLGAFVLISALLVGAIIQRNRNPLYQLSRYSRNTALKQYVSYVSTEIEPFTEEKSILGVHEPMDGSFGEVLSYEINYDGSFNLGSIYPNKAFGNYDQWSLSPSQFTEVKRLIKQLPPGTPPQKSGDVIVVLIGNSARHPVRLYDRLNLPTQISEILGILIAAIKEDRSSVSSGKSIQNSNFGRSKLVPQIPNAP